MQVNNYAIKLEIETVQCSFLRLRLSGNRVLPLSMRYASLPLRRDMLRVGCNSSRISSMSAMEWPAGWLKWEGTAAVAFAWSGLFVACLCYLKRSRNVHLVSPTFCLVHLLHWIIYVRFVESLVMWCLICLVSPVLLKVRWGSHVWSCDKRNVLAGGLDVLSMLASFARTSISRRFGERPKATAGCFMRKGYLFLEKWYIKGCPCINHGKTSYKGLELGAEPPRINICWVTPPGFHTRNAPVEL